MHTLLVLVISLLAAGKAVSYTLNKCCPEHQQLSLDFRTCVDYNQSVSSARARARARGEHKSNTPTDLPWWFPPDVDILDVDSLTPVSHGDAFFNGRFPLQVQYGMELPCSYQSTHYILPQFTEYLVFLDDGSLMINDNGFSDVKKNFPGITYCVDRVNVPEEDPLESRGNTNNNTSDDTSDGTSDVEEAWHVIKLCLCLTQPCLKKCCGAGKVLQILEGNIESECVLGDNLTIATMDWRPGTRNEHDANETVDITTYSVLTGLPSCPRGQTPLLLNPTSVNRNYTYWVRKNGDIHIEKLGVQSESPYKEYCADITKFEDGTVSRNLVHCEPTPILEASSDAYGVLVVVSAIFLLATLLVYAGLPELRNVHGKNLMAHTASFLLGYSCLGVVHLLPSIPHNACVAIGFVIQFSFLAAFFWLNVMCVDISWTFSTLRAMHGSGRVRDDRKFVYYSIYAWGSTGLISLATAFMEFTPASISTLKPGFGITSCLFNGVTASLVFFYVPMTLLLVVNVVLFVYTAARIIAIRRQTTVLFKPGSAAYNKNKQRTILFVKLFLLMGVTWITEIISWAVGGPAYYWYLTDILNLLRAAFMFIIFCCKKSVYDLFKRRFLKSSSAQASKKRSTSTKKRKQNENIENSESQADNFPSTIVISAPEEPIDLRKISTTTIETTIEAIDVIS